VIDASGCMVLPGLVDLAVRLREPGYEHARMLESEMAAAVAGGVTSLVCQPDTDPVLDESGLVEMLRFRAEKLQPGPRLPARCADAQAQGATLTEMVELTEAGCVAFSQAEVPLANTQVTAARLAIRQHLRLRGLVAPAGCCFWARAWPPAATGHAHGACPACRWHR
jgi:dihydroorotase